MQLLTSLPWKDYELIDSGEGFRLERFGTYILSRPDPQIIWKKSLHESHWLATDYRYIRLSQDKGRWVKKNDTLPEKWLLSYDELSFYAKLTPFKHTGIFPEQRVQWDEIKQSITKAAFQPTILNLFGYTGIATLVAAKAGAKVTHVDASRPAIGWARENQQVSQLADKPVRWIVDDATKFVQRELKRGVQYDGILMDPPVFGHGPDGSVWKFNEHIPSLLSLCRQVLSPHPLFVYLNAYAISSSALTLGNILKDYFSTLGGSIHVGELVLTSASSDQLLSTGIYGKWTC